LPVEEKIACRPYRVYNPAALIYCDRPYVALKTAVPPVIKPPVCPAGETAVTMHYNAGTSVRLIRESVLQLDWLPEFHYGRYKIFIHNLPNDEAINILSQVEPPAT
jgi:hypothetical protein